MAGVQELELEGVIGFSGVQRHALLLHPNDAHIIYPLGATVVIRNVHDNKDQTFLQGHTDRVTCITMSKDGKLLASGQITHMGYLAQIMVWDISQIGTGQPKLMHVLKLHKVQIQALAFSCHGSYLASLGGADDNNLVIWRVEDGMAICGSPASHDSALTLCWYATLGEKLHRSRATSVLTLLFLRAHARTAATSEDARVRAASSPVSLGSLPTQRMRA